MNRKLANLARTATVVPAVLALSACATNVPLGGLYTDLTLPFEATSAAGGSKTGTAVCNSYLTLIATGDCSLAAAKADGGITTVTHVDWDVDNLLGLIGTYTLTVTGD